ncbi:hypothetical protein ACWGIB_27250 [Streptomyces xiamenensis]
MDAVVAAVAALRDPSLPGAPWTAAEIAALLPHLEAAPSPADDAVTARWLAAVDEGAELPEG